MSGVSGGSSASRGPIPACPSAASSRLTGNRRNATSCALTVERPKGLELGGWGGAKSASRLQLAADRPPAGAAARAAPLSPRLRPFSPCTLLQIDAGRMHLIFLPRSTRSDFSHDSWRSVWIGHKCQWQRPLQWKMLALGLAYPPVPQWPWPWPGVSPEAQTLVVENGFQPKNHSFSCFILEEKFVLFSDHDPDAVRALAYR